MTKLVIDRGDIVQLDPVLCPFGALLGVVVNATDTSLTIDVYVPRRHDEQPEVRKFVVPHGHYRIVGHAAWIGSRVGEPNPTDN